MVQVIQPPPQMMRLSEFSVFSFGVAEFVGCIVVCIVMLMIRSILDYTIPNAALIYAWTI